MAITAPIPMPESGADAFGSGMTTSQSIINSMMQNKLIPSQIQEQQGKAAQSSMIAQLLNKAMGGGNGSGMNSNMGALASAVLGFPTQTQVVDGKLIQTNPISGTSQEQVGQTPDEKKQTAIDQANAEAQAKEKIDSAKDIETQASDIRDMHGDLTQLNQLMKDNPDLGGMFTGIKMKLGQSNDPNASTFQSLAGDLQIKLARNASNRGGIGIVNWTKGIKPDIGNKPGQNAGLITSGLGQAERKYKDLDDRYFENTGRHLPELKAEQSSQGGSTNLTPKTTGNGMVVLYKNGKEYHLPPKLMNEALTKGGFTLGN